MALASTYFIGVIADGAQRGLNVDPAFVPGDPKRGPVLRARPEAPFPGETLRPRRWRGLGRPQFRDRLVAILDQDPTAP
jgi:hypothetical protein